MMFLEKVCNVLVFEELSPDTEEFFNRYVRTMESDNYFRKTKVFWDIEHTLFRRDCHGFAVVVRKSKDLNLETCQACLKLHFKISISVEGGTCGEVVREKISKSN